ncbi:hypothetical protein CAEBREN_04655 [Caenorhabditis brenneri]|uniref:Uncharacterized protein n=1 Tax=Caenorhabditis brenneri TaxID=135651 RepID=G0MDJ3_CAEBE|nr:hypothetical protein CAEBREN_04655 [Caenorhabditis brenneri]
MVSTAAPARRDCSIPYWILFGVLSFFTICLMLDIVRSFYLKRKKIAKKEKSEKKETTTTTDVGATGNQQ